MPKFRVTGFYTFKVLSEIEASDEEAAMQEAADLWPDTGTDIPGVEIDETFIESAEEI